MADSSHPIDRESGQPASDRLRTGRPELARRVSTKNEFHPAAVAAEVGRPPFTREGVTFLAESLLPTRFGAFNIMVARVDDASVEVVVLTRGDLTGDEPALTRVQSECLTGEVLGSLRCDCGDQLAEALTRIASLGRGALLYLRQEGRGIGLANKIRAYALQDRGLDTVDANVALGLPVDGRNYRPAAQVLRALGVRQVHLLTNNPAKCRALELYDIQVATREPLEVPANDVNRAYLQAKASRLGHVLSLLEADEVQP